MLLRKTRSPEEVAEATEEVRRRDAGEFNSDPLEYISSERSKSDSSASAKILPVVSGKKRQLSSSADASDERTTPEGEKKRMLE
ncbi:Uu.00g013110.m01.CDS01 [Anthostomella pinea]|uniref:Uu.00g013110.m01.CDS01 n=1 Tax=Anthostomella pinea TaxID=933095 RepID=A0AAI8VY32_9PEZI|nr:Uu.00g013110.m01.CDS01 [Anthostomella pinea]